MAESSPAASSVVRFGDFELDVRSGELTRNGRRQPLAGQPFEVLALLIERPGELITRDELQHRLWAGDAFGDFEHGLNAAVKRLRDALGDSAEVSRYVETVPRRGYRFIAHVSPLPNGDSPPVPPAGPPWFQRLWSFVGSHPWTSAATLAALLAAAAAIVSWKVLAPPTPTGTKDSRPHPLSRVTFGPGFDTDPSWSPDGRFIAYASNRSGNYDIWVQALAGGAPVQVTQSPASETKPSWSPDGTDLIVFRSERNGGGLFVISAHGGPERQLTTFGFQPKWAPDGSRVLFVSSDIGPVPRFYSVGLDGANPQEVLKPFMDNVESLLGWNWHPDGRRVTLLAHHTQRGWALFTVPLSGSPILPEPAIVEANTAKALEFCQCPAWAGDRRLHEWAPSGAAIYFQCAHDLTMDVWRFTVDPVTLRILATDRMTTGTGQALPLAVSPDGRRVAYTARTMRLRLWSFPFDAAAGRITGAGEPVTDSSAYVWESALSSNGRRLAYLLGREGSSRDELWTADLETGRRHPWPDDGQNRNTPHWSPDSAHLAYVWWKAGANNKAQVALGISDPEGGDAQLATVPQVVSPDGRPFYFLGDWSSDGSRVVASLNPGPSVSSIQLGVWTLSNARRVERDFHVVASDKDVDAWQGQFSPNGRWIGFVASKRDEPGAAIVEVIPSTGADRRDWVRVSDEHDFASRVRWSPDGRLLYYTTRRNGFWNLWAVHFDDQHGRPLGEPFQVTHFANPERELSSLLETADVGLSANRLIVTMMERTGSIWFVDNVDR